MKPPSLKHAQFTFLSHLTGMVPFFMRRAEQRKRVSFAGSKLIKVLFTKGDNGRPGANFWVIYEYCAFECGFRTDSVIDVIARVDIAEQAKDAVYIPATNSIWIITGNKMSVFNINTTSQEVRGVLEDDLVLLSHVEKLGLVVGVTQSGTVSFWDVTTKGRVGLRQLFLATIVQGDVIGDSNGTVTAALLDDLGRINLISFRDFDVMKQQEFTVFAESKLELHCVKILSQPRSLLVVDSRGYLSLISFFDGHTITSRSSLEKNNETCDYSVERSVSGIPEYQGTLSKLSAASLRSSRSCAAIVVSGTNGSGVRETERRRSNKVRCAGASFTLSDINTRQDDSPLLGGIHQTLDKATLWVWSKDGTKVHRMCVSGDELVSVSCINEPVLSVLACSSEYVVCLDTNGDLSFYTERTKSAFKTSCRNTINNFTPSLRNLNERLRSQLSIIVPDSSFPQMQYDNINSFTDVLANLIILLESYYREPQSIDTPVIVARVKDSVRSSLKFIEVIFDSQMDEKPTQQIKTPNEGRYTNTRHPLLISTLVQIQDVLGDINGDIISPRGSIVLSQLTPTLGSKSLSVRSHLVGHSLKRSELPMSQSTMSRSLSATQPVGEIAPVQRGVVHDLVKQIDDLQSEKREMNDRQRGDREQITKYESILESLKAGHDKIKQELKGKIVKRDRTINQLRKELLGKETQVKHLLVEIGRKSDELDGAKAQLLVKDNDILLYEKELERLEEDLSDKIYNIDELNKIISRLDSDVEGYKTELERLKGEKETVEAREQESLAVNEDILRWIRDELRGMEANASSTTAVMLEACGLEESCLDVEGMMKFMKGRMGKETNVE